MSSEDIPHEDQSLTARAQEAHRRGMARHVLDSIEASPWTKREIGGKITLHFVDHMGEGVFLQPEQLQHVWLGTDDEDMQDLGDTLKNWGEFLAKEYPDQDARLQDIHVVVCSDIADLSNVTDAVPGMNGDAAYTMPFADTDLRDSTTLRFLIMLPYPQPAKSREAEKNWLVDSASHELEHVWQFLTIASDNLGVAWLDYAEMCAMMAEQRSRVGARSYVDYGAAFLTRLPAGLLTPHAIDGMVRGLGAADDARKVVPIYWFFPFLDRLDRKLKDTCKVKDGCRDIWKMWGGSGAVSSPWSVIDEALSSHGLSLAAEWTAFCQGVVRKALDCEMVRSMNDRFNSRSPSWRVDLLGTQPITTYNFKVSPLGVHWIHLAGAGKGCQFTWSSIPPRSGITVHCVSAEDVWRQIESGWEIPDDGQHDFLIIDTQIPTPRNLPDLTASGVSVTFEEPARALVQTAAVPASRS
jgi:hypothetical protein